MEINVNKDARLVEIWLSNAEKRDPAVRERLKPFYRECKAKHYLVAVFESGEQDLAEATSSLLLYNRKRIAELEVEQEKKQGVGA